MAPNVHHTHTAQTANWSQLAVWLCLSLFCSNLLAQTPCTIKQKYRYEPPKKPLLISISTYSPDTKTWTIEHKNWQQSTLIMHFDSLQRPISQCSIDKYRNDSTAITYDEKPYQKVIYEYRSGQYSGKQTFLDDTLHSLQIERHTTEKNWTLSEQRHYCKKYANKTYPIATVDYWISEQGEYQFQDSTLYLYTNDTLAIGERYYEKDQQIKWSLSTDIEYQDNGKKEIYYWFEGRERKIHYIFFYNEKHQKIKSNDYFPSGDYSSRTFEYNEKGEPTKETYYNTGNELMYYEE